MKQAITAALVLTFCGLLCGAAQAASSACSGLGAASAWHGQIAISVQRSVQNGSGEIERLKGDFAYTADYAPPPYGVHVIFNGYDFAWTGKPQGSGSFDQEVVRPDGSPLSKPLTIRGSGAILRDPPLGKFGPEQFWINPAKCVYAFYTSAALHAVHSYEAPRIDGVAAHVEEIPIAPQAKTLRGTKTLSLPHENYHGGDQFSFPCILLDWCYRGSGSATISWSFTPTSFASARPTPPGKAECKNTERDTGAPLDRVRADLSAAFVVDYRDIAVSAGAGLRKFEVRLGKGNHALPSMACINEGIANGSVAPGSQAGATQLLLGAIQQLNGTTRVTVRIVDVATGQILATGLGDAPGTSDASIQQAATLAYSKLGVAIN